MMLRVLLLTALATTLNAPARTPDPLEIPPPLVAEPTPIPLPPGTPVPAAPLPTPPSTTPQGLITPMIRPEMLELIPTFLVRDMDKALAFYTGKLGFGIILKSGNTYTAIARDFAQIGLAQERKIPKGQFSSSYIKMTLVDAYYDELKARGVKITSPLKTQPSKMREFSVTDPDGNVLIFGEYTGPK